MSHSDPIADMLTRIRNALMVGHLSTSMPSSTIKVAIAGILKEEGYITDYTVIENEPAPILNIDLKYFGATHRDRRPVITGVKRVSKPGRRQYVGKAEIPWVLRGMGTAILSTPKGVMTGQTARKLGIGGEVLCYVW
ncbi:MAG: 30S ribosomal protein S8 [Anaerolineae bacterium]|nr:30S ribosomal protein S8 [Anaerolineae bacterium]